jgi:hypothetical protein
VTAGNGITVSGGVVALDYYTGSSSLYTSYPIGTYCISAGAGGGSYSSGQLNSTVTPYIFSFCGAGQSTRIYLGPVSPSGYYTSLAGTWRNRGNAQTATCPSINVNLIQRTA